MSLGHATQQPKLQSSHRFGVVKADFATGLLIWRSVLCTNTGSFLLSNTPSPHAFSPVPRFVLCICVAQFGSIFADHLWYHQFYPHERLQRLQATIIITITIVIITTITIIIIIIIIIATSCFSYFCF